MTNPILLGMACEYTRKLEPCSDLSGFDQTSAMKAALLYLADNVSDEMSIAAVVDWQNDKSGETLQEWLQSAISAALRAAAGSTPTPPEVK